MEKAKRQVKILLDWQVESTNKTLPEEVLTKFVLPFVADVVSPIHELGGANLHPHTPTLRLTGS